MRKAYIITITSLIALAPVILFIVSTTQGETFKPEVLRAGRGAFIVQDLMDDVHNMTDVEKLERFTTIFGRSMGVNLEVDSSDFSSENKIALKIKSGDSEASIRKEVRIDDLISEGQVIPMDSKQTDMIHAYRMVQLVLEIPETVLYFGKDCTYLDTVEYDGDYCYGFFSIPVAVDIAALKIANPEIENVTVHTLSAPFLAENYKELYMAPKIAWVNTEEPNLLEESDLIYLNVTISDINSTYGSSQNYLFDNGFTVAIVPETALTKTSDAASSELYEFVSLNGTVYLGGVSGTWFLEQNS